MRARTAAALVLALLNVPLTGANTITVDGTGTVSVDAGRAYVWIAAPLPQVDNSSVSMPLGFGAGAGAGAGGMRAQAAYHSDFQDPSGCESGCDPCGSSCDPCSPVCDPCANGCPAPPIVDNLQRQVDDLAHTVASDFGITYYSYDLGRNPESNPVAYQWHGILNASISCPSGWETTIQTTPAAVPGLQLAYEIWYSPARLQEIRTENGLMTITTGTCTTPSYHPYPQVPLSGKNAGCFPQARAEPPASLPLEQQHVGWQIHNDTGVKTVLTFQDEANGFDEKFAIRHAKARFCWEVTALADDMSRQPGRTEAGIPFTGAIHANGAGMECRSASFLAGKPWLDASTEDGCLPTWGPTYAPNIILSMRMSALGFLFLTQRSTPAVAGTFAITFQTCDSQCE